MRKDAKSKIERVFEQIKANKLVFGNHKHKKQLSDRTIDTYCDVIKAYENYLKTECGLKDITRAKPRHAYEYIQKQIARYQDGEGSAFTMRRFAHALHAMQEASAVTGVFQHQLKLGDKRQILKELTEKQIFRKSEDSKTLKANHNDYLKVQKEILGSRSPNAETISKIHESQRHLGLRVTEALTIQKRHITFNPNGSVMLQVTGKGGLVRHVTTDHQETVRMLKQQVANKKDGAPIFQLKNQASNDKSVAGAVKQVKEVVRNAAKRANVDRDGQKYTTHSGRKAYAQTNMDRYSQMSVKQLRNEISKRIAEDTENKLKHKLDNTLKHIRNKITDEAARVDRELNHKELCTFLVSHDLGHFRLDVVRYYCTYPKKS